MKSANRQIGYLAENLAAIYMKGETLPCRIDVVAIVLSPANDLIRLTHYENVYM